jgi:hypothetical protein
MVVDCAPRGLANCDGWRCQPTPEVSSVSTERDTQTLTPPHGIAGSRLASLAVLPANFDVHGRSFLDNFVPFITQALLDLGRASSLPEVAPRSCAASAW